MAAGLRIRDLQPAEVETVAALARQCTDHPWSREQLAGTLGAVNSVALLARWDSRPCGYVIFRFAADEAEILQLGVRAGQRRKGVATALLREGLIRLAARGAATCYLEVRHSNRAARSLYLREGFLEQGRRRNYYVRPVEDAVIMKKDLQDNRDDENDTGA